MPSFVLSFLREMGGVGADAGYCDVAEEAVADTRIGGPELDARDVGSEDPFFALWISFVFLESSHARGSDRGTGTDSLDLRVVWRLGVDVIATASLAGLDGDILEEFRWLRGREGADRRARW